MIIEVLAKQKELADLHINSYKSVNRERSLEIRKTLDLHSESKYDAILDFLPSYFCETENSQILLSFFDTLWSNRSSANEMPAYSIGDCFSCNPDLVLENLRTLSDSEKRNLILSPIDWGLINLFDVDSLGISSNSEYQNLKKTLDSFH